VSLANMRPSDLAHLVGAALGAGMDARQLTLELQQVAVLDTLPPKETAAIAPLRKKGLRIALDRFGCSASILHLRKLACDEIKVDATLVRELDRDAAVQAILLGIGDLARRMKIACVACGVDTPAQLAFLKKNGWGEGQGRVFGEPLSGLNFAARWLTRSGRPLRIATPGDAT
jgi:diguanylate cyclase